MTIPAEVLECLRTGQALCASYEQQPTAATLSNVRRAIAMYHAALAGLDPLRALSERATVLHSLGNAYRIVLGPERRACLERAVACYTAALGVFTRAEFPGEWAATQTNLGTAWSSLASLGTDGGDGDELRRAIACFQSALSVRSETATPGPWALNQHNMGNAYLRMAEAGHSEAARGAIDSYQAALRVRTRDASPLQWARTTRSLADAYLYLPDGVRDQHLALSIELATSALSVLNREVSAADWAGAHVTLAEAYRILPTDDRNWTRETAITHLEAALSVFTAPDFRDERLKAQARLADTLLDLPADNRRGNLLRAIELYRDWLAVAGDSVAAPRRIAIWESLAEAYAETDDADAAAGGYEQMLRLCDKDADPGAWASVQQRLGDLLSGRAGRGRPDDGARALTHYQAALEVYSKAVFPEEWAAVQINMGVCYAADSVTVGAIALKRAIACYEAALGVLDEQRSATRWATAHLNLGNALCRLGGVDGGQNLSRAIEHFHCALRVDTERESPIAWAGIQNSLGTAFLKLGSGDTSANLTRASACFEAALRVLSESETPERWAGVQCGLASVYWESARRSAGLSAYRAAIAHYEAALRVWTEDAHPIEWAKTMGQLGPVYATLARTMADADRAIGACDAALRVVTEKDRPADWAVIQYNRGCAGLALRVGNREEALQTALSCFGRASRVLDRRELPLEWALVQFQSGVAHAQLRSGNAEHNLGQALAFFSNALQIYDERRLPSHWAAVQADIGAVYARLHQLGIPGAAAEAGRAFEAALRVYTPATSRTEWARIKVNLGTLYSKADDHEDLRLAMDCCKAALEVLTAENEPDLWATAQNCQGTLYGALSSSPEDRQQAIECFELALRVFTPEHRPADCLRTTGNLALTFFASQAWHDALARYVEAASIAERLRNLSADESSRRRVLRDSLDLFDRGMLSAIRARQYGRALEFVERTKARNLADQVRRGEYRPRGVNETDWRRYQDLARQLSVESLPSDDVFDQAAAMQQQALLEQMSTMRQEAARLEQHFANADPDYALIDPSPDPDRIVSVARQIDAVLVDFRLTSQGSYAFLVGPDGGFGEDHVVPIRLTIQHRLPRRAPAGFAGVMGGDDVIAGSAEALLREIDTLVMGPVRERLRQLYPAVKRLILIPSHALAILPIHAACRQIGDAEPAYLLDDYEIAWVPNALVLERCLARATRQPRPDASLFAVDNPDGSLPFAAWEVSEIAKLFPQNARRVLAGREASREAVGRNLPFGTEKLFSCHASFRADAPDSSHLQLADGVLALPDLLRADLRHASLIVMSACTSGLIDLHTLDIDEHFGLATACLVAGAQTVVASLWKVSDVATALLMQRFHENLYVRRLEKARALQEAQCWLRDMNAEDAFARLEQRQEEAGDDRAAAADAAQALLNVRERGPKPFAHPYWWAAFQCIGAGWTPRGLLPVDRG